MITIDYKDRRPIYEQIVVNIERLIALNVLKQDEKLPSVRSLAIELSINPNTIQKAYTMLEQKQLIYTVKGVGNFISKGHLDVKDDNLIKIYAEVEEKIYEAINYGLNKEIFNEWEMNLRRVINDKSSKS